MSPLATDVISNVSVDLIDRDNVSYFSAPKSRRPVNFAFDTGSGAIFWVSPNSFQPKSYTSRIITKQKRSQRSFITVRMEITEALTQDCGL